MCIAVLIPKYWRIEDLIKCVEGTHIPLVIEEGFGLIMVHKIDV